MDTDQAELVTSAIARTPVSIVLTDPRIDDNPITYVNDAFQKITLYSREFALGRNCRFLQGDETEADAVEAIREGLREQREFQVVLTNYRADGKPFRNQLIVSPIRNEAGEVTAFFGVQRVLNGDDESREDIKALDLLQELQHRVKNHLSMVVSMIRIQAMRKVSPELLRAVGRRVEALALLYEELFNVSSGGGGETVRTGAYLSRIASTIAGLEGRSAITVNVDCDEVDLPIDRAARLGLMLSELLTNALEHAFDGRDTGVVRVRFKRLSGGGGVRLTVEDDGVGLPKDSNWPYGSMSVERQRRRAEREDGELDTTGEEGRSGVGGTIILSLTQTLGATLDVNRALRGTIVTVDFETGATP